MSTGLLVDSDVVIDFLRGDDRAKAFLKKNSDSLFFSAVTVAEIYAGARGAKDESDIERLFSTFPVLPVTSEIAKRAGAYVKQYRPSHALEIPDALIAATCVVSDLGICTRNIKHFPMFANLQPPYSHSSLQ